MKDKWDKICILLIGLVVIAIGGVYTVRHSEKDFELQKSDFRPAIELPSEEVENQPEEAEEIVQYIQVYITGHVKNPDIYTLAEGSRIADLIELAGGATEEASLERINISAYVQDAQHVIIPGQGDEPGTTGYENNVEIAAEKRVNINTASAEELKTLPNVGDVTASNIIAYRQENGNFKTIDEIKNVSRIGEKTFERLKDLITVN